MWLAAIFALAGATWYVTATVCLVTLYVVKMTREVRQHHLASFEPRETA